MRKRVVLERYDPRWRRSFEREARAIRGALQDVVLGLEHFGSTSISEMASKPIIDIVVGVASLPIEPPILSSLATLNYERVAEMAKRFPGMEYFHKGPEVSRTYHLHVVVYKGPAWVRYLAFRDHLRRSQDTAREYESLKRNLAKRFKNDRYLYTEAKRSFVDAVVERILGTGRRLRDLGDEQDFGGRG